MGTSTATLKSRLDGLCARYDTAGALVMDPITVPLAYPAPLDREVAAFVAAHLVMLLLPKNRGLVAGMLTGSLPAELVRRRFPRWLEEPGGSKDASPLEAARRSS